MRLSLVMDVSLIPFPPPTCGSIVEVHDSNRTHFRLNQHSVYACCSTHTNGLAAVA